jgi:hypothetical protein
MTLILSNQDVDELLTMPECIAALEDAYRELAQRHGVNRRRSDSLVPTARADALYGLKTNQFAAAGAAVYRKAKAQRRGRELPTEWFTEDVHP